MRVRLCDCLRALACDRLSVSACVCLCVCFVAVVEVL